MRNGRYELVLAPEGYSGKRYRGRYCYEHILNWWKHTGLFPPAGFEIHHKNMNHRDNRIENLQLVTSKEHKIIHGKIRTEEATIFATCLFCQKKFSLLQRDLKWKSKNNKRGIFCSRTCIGKMIGHGRKVESGRVVERPQSC